MAIGQQVGRKLWLDGKGRRGFAESMRVWPNGVLFRTFRALSAWVKRPSGWDPNPGRRIQRAREIVVKSGFFDADWYLETYPDVARAGLDPLDHFLAVGWREGRDPGPLFTTSAYVKAYDDVASAGANPLVHFIEFGQAEGRSGFGNRHTPVAMDVTALADLPEASEPLSRPRTPIPSSPWVAAELLDASDPRLVVIDEAKLGFAGNRVSEGAVHGMVATLRWLSGRREGGKLDEVTISAGAGLAVADAWFVNNVTLRLRAETDDHPVVLRAWQVCPRDGGRIKLVGEGLVLSRLDVIDLQLVNPWFPLLIVSASPLGEILGGRLLGFPSLLRGGPHYAELLWHCDKLGRFDCAAIDGMLLYKLADILLEKTTPAVANIWVGRDASGGKGTLFQKDFRQWLNLVLGVSVSDQTETVPTVAKASRCRTSDGVLSMTATSIPTVAALVAAAVSGDASRRSLLVAHLDPSEPVLLLVTECCAALGAQWPQLSVAPDEPSPTAIARSTAARLSEAELLIPVSADGLAAAAKPRPPITWIVDPAEWRDDQLWEAVRSLSLQQGSEKDELLLLGPSAAPILDSVARAFVGPVTARETLDEAAFVLSTPLVGFLGAGVVLHNDATTRLFASLLNQPGVDTASCVMVAASRKAGVIKAHVIDGPAVLAASGGRADLADATRAAKELWRTAFPVAKPSELLWATRTDTLQRWLDAGAAPEPVGVHLCSTVITASAAGAATGEVAFHAPPSAKAIQMRWLVG